MKKMTAGRHLAVSIGMGAAVLTAGAPAVAAADTPDAGTGSSASTATDGSPVAAPSSESAGASNGTSPVSTPSTTAPGSTSVTVDSAEATGSVAPSSAATADSSAPATESTPSSAPGTPLDAALATGTPSPGSHQSPTVTATPPVDTPDQPYGKHAAPEPSSTPSVVSGAESALVTSPSPAPTMPEGATADVTEYTPYVDWRSDAEVTSLESISGKEAVVSEAPVENEISSTGTAPVAATALALTTMGAGAATTRPRLTANSTPEEIAAYYAWIEETKTASQAADATNEYWNYGDDDWTAAWNTGDPTADGAFIKTGAPAGLTYSVDDSRVTLHNNSTTDVAVVGLLYPDYSSQGVTVIRAGESYTIEESGSNPLGVNGYIVQTARQDGKPVLIGQITTMQSSLMPFSVTVAPVTSTHQQSDYILLQGTSVIDPSHADPGDRFVDQNEYLASIGSDGSPSLIRHFVNPEPAGVSYSKNSDGSTTIFNEGTDDIAISQSTTGGQILAFDILKPGQRATYTAVPGSPVSSVEVQAPRSHSNEYNVLGAVTFAYTVTGPVSSSPGNGIPAIPVHDAPLPENHAPGGTLEAQQKPANQRTMHYVAHVSDIDGDSLTYSIVKQPTNGVVTNHGDGTFTFTPTDPADLHDGVVGKPVTAWDLLAGDFTTMPDNSFVVEVSDGKGGSSRIGAIVYYMFTEEDNTPPGVTVTGGQSGVGEGAWKISIDDADGDRTTYYVGTQPAFGRASSSTPYTTEDGVVHDDHLIFYTPDLVRAHQGAYDDTFTVTVNDGHYGGLVSTPVSVHVPFHNYAPTAIIDRVAGSNGEFVGSSEFALQLEDRDGDDVIVVSATSSRGGTVLVQDGVLRYTPPALVDAPSDIDPSYAYQDTITVVIEDGHGGTTTETKTVFVRNTAAFQWLPKNLARTLIFDTLDNPWAIETKSLTTLYASGYSTYAAAFSPGFQERISALESRYRPYLNGYGDALQRYMVQNFAKNLIDRAIINTSKTLSQLESFVEQLDETFARLGSPIRIATHIAREFLSSAQWDLYSGYSNFTGIPSRSPSASPGEDNSGPVSEIIYNPLSTAKLFDTLWTKQSREKPFYVEHVKSDRDGVERVIVYVGGTDVKNGSVQSVPENSWASAGIVDADLDRAVSDAIGSNSRKEILLVGYSQGGIDAINLANSGRFNVAGVVTFASPLTTASSVDYPAIHIRDSRDTVTKPPFTFGPWETYSREIGRVFEGTANTPDNRWYVPFKGAFDVHTNPDTFTQLGKRFDNQLETADGKERYRAIGLVLSRFQGDVKATKSYGNLSGGANWL